MQRKTQSPSSLLMFKNDPAKYRFKYILGYPSGTSPEMQRGTLVHEWIEKLIETGKEPEYDISNFSKDQKSEILELISNCRPVRG